MAVKRAKPVTMTSRSKGWLEKQGYIVALVERSIWIPRKVNGIPTGEKFLQKFDCFGFADLVACHSDKPGTLYIQTTTQDHAAERRNKILAASAVPVILKGGNHIHVHGWAKKGGRGQRKLWQVNIYKLGIHPGGRLEFLQLPAVEVEDDGSTSPDLFMQAEPVSPIPAEEDF